jgi:hypothetical protein
VRVAAAAALATAADEVLLPEIESCQERAAALAQAAASLCRESAPRRHVSAQVDGHALVILSNRTNQSSLLAFDSKVRQLKQNRGAIYPLRLAPPFLLGKEAHAKLKHDWNA